MKFFVRSILLKSTFGRHKGIKKIKQPKVYHAEIFWPNGTMNTTTATKSGGLWMVGGDKAVATTSLGGKINILIDNKIYYLKGSRLIFQDNLRDDHPHYDHEDKK
jgi:hypothetical protein